MTQSATAVESIAPAERRTLGLEELPGLVGETLGISPWLVVDQDMIDRFAEATLDHQWIHVAPERAARESPYGTTVAHGYLTLSLLPHLRDATYAVVGQSATINYGLGRVRFPAPVRAGRRIRATFLLKECAPRDDGTVMATVEAKVEVEDEERPACIAETIGLYVP